jgi:hypothetical protein
LCPQREAAVPSPSFAAASRPSPFLPCPPCMRISTGGCPSVQFQNVNGLTASNVLIRHCHRPKIAHLLWGSVYRIDHAMDNTLELRWHKLERTV